MDRTRHGNNMPLNCFSKSSIVLISFTKQQGMQQLFIDKLDHDPAWIQFAGDAQKALAYVPPPSERLIKLLFGDTLSRQPDQGFALPFDRPIDQTLFSNSHLNLIQGQGGLYDLALNAGKFDAMVELVEQNLLLWHNDDLSKDQADSLYEYLKKEGAFEELESNYRVSNLFYHFELDRFSCDFFTPTSFELTLQLPPLSRVFLVPSLLSANKSTRLGAFELHSKDQREWSSVGLPEFCINSICMPYSSWGLELAVLQPCSEINTKPFLQEKLQVTIQCKKHWLCNLLSRGLVNLSCPIFFGQNFIGQTRLGIWDGGDKWQRISYFSGWDTIYPWTTPVQIIQISPYEHDPRPKLDLCQWSHLSLQLPNRPSNETMLIQFGKDPNLLSELEMAICLGDIDSVFRIIERCENSTLLQ